MILAVIEPFALGVAGLTPGTTAFCSYELSSLLRDLTQSLTEGVGIAIMLHVLPSHFPEVFASKQPSPSIQEKCVGVTLKLTQGVP